MALAGVHEFVDEHCADEDSALLQAGSGDDWKLDIHRSMSYAYEPLASQDFHGQDEAVQRQTVRNQTSQLHQCVLGRRHHSSAA